MLPCLAPFFEESGYMKKVVKFAALLAAALVFVSCSGLTDSGPNFPILQTSQTNPQGAASNRSHKTVIFSGALSSGALPRAIANSVSSNSGKNVSASASPDIQDSEYYYYVKTTCQETGEETEYDQGDPVFVSGSRSIAFEVPLVTGYTWVIECGFKKTGLEDPVLFDQTKPIPLDETTSVISASFVARPNPAANGGKGSVHLDLSGSYMYATVSCDDEGWTAATGSQTSSLVVDPDTGAATLDLDSIKAGAYYATFSFYNSDSVMVYQTAQMISVLAGMQTNSWVASDGDDGDVINSDRMFVVGEQAMQAFDRRTFYVGQSVPGAQPANTNAGTAYAPFATYGAAIKAIATRGDSSQEYNIYICGEVQADPNDATAGMPSGKVKSIVISGINGLDGNGRPKDTIKGAAGVTSVLMFNYGVPIRIRNLCVQGAPDFATANAIEINGGAKSVCLEPGVLITGCQHGVVVSSAKLIINGGTISGNKAIYGSGDDLNGAGVRLGPGSSFEMNGGAITGNTAGGSGGGIWFRGGDFSIANGEISKNSAKEGAGLYWWGQNSGEISGGKIFQNEAAGFGGGIYVHYHTPDFSIMGGEIYQNTAPVLSDSGSFGMQPGGGAMCIVSTTCSIGQSAYIPYGDKNGAKSPGKNDISYVKGTGSSADMPLVIQSPLSRHSLAAPIALTPNWERGWQLYKSDSASLTLSETDKFLLTDDSWEKKYSEDEKTAMVDSPIYVGSYNGELGNDTTNDGSKTQPFRTLARACEKMDNANVDYTIKLSGSTYKAVTGGAIAQEIPSTLLNTGSGESGKNYARSVTISGFGDDATINRGAPSEIAISDGYALKISSAVPVILTKVTVTGGHNSDNGGGIIVEQGATLCLGKGTKVIGNKTEDGGGGIYSKGKVFVYSDAKIGERDETNLTDAKYVANESYFSNWAKGCGGGICLEADVPASVAGELYLGYYRDTDGSAKKDESFTGGIFYNYSKVSGGAIYVRGYAAKKAKLAVTGGTIAYNAAYTSGGGIYTAGTVDLDAGTIKENEANYGGAIIQKSDSNINFNGSLSIPYGNGTLTKPWNDIYVSNGKLVALGSGFTSSEQMLLAPETESGVSFKRRKVFSGTTNMSKFDLTIKGFKLDSTIETGYGCLALKNIVTTIYVASTADSGDARTGSKGSDPSSYATFDSTWNNSTYAYNESTDNKTMPFATIKKALQFITYQESASAYTIKIDGTLTGSHSIANDTSSAYYPIRLAKSASDAGPATATKITLASKNIKTSDTSPVDILDGKYTSATNNGTTLSIVVDVPVVITDLGITGGNNNGSGGGISVTNTDAVVTLNGKTKVYGNTARDYGGGIFSMAKQLFIYDKVVIGNSGVSYPPVSTDAASTGRNSAGYYGGGIYASGDLYLGYSAANTPAEWTGGVIYNIVTNSTYGFGGGVYSDEKSVYMAYGNVSYNNAAVNGGGIYLKSASLYMHGDAVVGTARSDDSIAEANNRSNQAKNGAGVYCHSGTVRLGYKGSGNGKEADFNSGKGVLWNYAFEAGAGIYAYGGVVEMRSGTISWNRVPTTNDRTGGGICMMINGSAGSMTMSGGVIARNMGCNGGGVWTECPFTMSGDAVIGDSSKNEHAGGSAGAYSNYGTYGGGVYLSGSNTSVSFNFNGGTIAYNYTSKRGGGIYDAAAGTVTIKNTIKCNYATSSSYTEGGGGLSITGSGTTTIDGATFVKNYSNYNNGGAVSCPYGTNLNLKGSITMASSGAQDNDIYLGTTNTNEEVATLTVTGSLGTSAMRVTPKTYDNSRVLYVTATDTTLPKAAANFTVTDNDTTDTLTWTIDSSGKLASGVSAAGAAAAIVAANDGDVISIAGPIETDDFASIKSALTTLKNNGNPMITLDFSKVVGMTEMGDIGVAYCGVNELILPEGLEKLTENMGRLDYCESINIPASVTEIDGVAFDGCWGLTNLTIDPSNPNYKIQNNALYTKDGKKLILYAKKGENNGSCEVISSCEVIGRYAFSNARKFKTLTFASTNTMKKIESNAFNSNFNLGEVVLPNSITEMESSSFAGASMPSITLPSGITEIAARTFTNGSFSSIVIPDGVTKIGDSAFWSTDTLGTVTLPVSVVEIEQGAFNGCAVTQYVPSGKLTIRYRGTEAQKNNIDIKRGSGQRYDNHELDDADWIYNWTGD